MCREECAHLSFRDLDIELGILRFFFFCNGPTFILLYSNLIARAEKLFLNFGEYRSSNFFAYASKPSPGALESRAVTDLKRSSLHVGLNLKVRRSVGPPATASSPHFPIITLNIEFTSELLTLKLGSALNLGAANS